jgi:hypothetical protein
MRNLSRSVAIGLAIAVVMAVFAGGMAMAEDTITGTVIQQGDIIVLDAVGGSYILEGTDQAPDMVGKKVTVTGTVAEMDNMKVISVMSMEEVQE